MNKKYARQLAETITNEELMEMLNNAKSGITDWEQTSSVNKGMTKGTAWNILGKGFTLETNHHVLGKTNMIREFGDYLPEHLQQPKKAKKERVTPVHQEPIFADS